MILLKFNEDVWPINDDDISLRKIQEATEKIIKFTSIIASLPYYDWINDPASQTVKNKTIDFQNLVKRLIPVYYQVQIQAVIQVYHPSLFLVF